MRVRHLQEGQEHIGKTVGIAGEHLTGKQMASAMTKALGREIRYNDVPPEIYRSFGFPGAEDLGNMFQYNRDFEAACVAAEAWMSVDRSTPRCRPSTGGSRRTRAAFRSNDRDQYWMRTSPTTERVTMSPNTCC